MEYVKSDGTIETAEKIEKYFTDLGVSPEEIITFGFVSTTSCCYWMESKAEIGNARKAPKGYKLKVL